MLREHRNLGFNFFEKTCCSNWRMCERFVCPSHKNTHKFQTSLNTHKFQTSLNSTIVVAPTLLHCSPLCFSFLQRSQFTEESGKLCNDVVSFHCGAVCCTVPFLVPRVILYCCVGSRTAWDLIQRSDSWHTARSGRNENTIKQQTTTTQRTVVCFNNVIVGWTMEWEIQGNDEI